MELTTKTKALGAGAVVALLVAWMLPPTTPKPLPTPSWRMQAGVKAPAPSERLSAPQDSPGPAVAPPAVSDLPELALPPTRDTARVEAPAPAEPRRRSPDAYGHDRLAASPPAPSAVRAPASEPSDYDLGYGWSERRDVQDPRECSLLGGLRAQDGCFDYIEDREEAQEHDPDRDRYEP